MASLFYSKFDFKHSSWKDFKDEYQGVSKGMFSSRTDGTFLDGMFLVQNAMIKIGSPKMILLQPIEYNAVGGKIILVDGKKVLESVLMERPKLAEISMKHGCISFCKDDQISINCCVYNNMPDDSIHVLFRYDSTTFVPDWSCKAIKLLYNNYHMNPKFQLKITLKKKSQISIMDNRQLLHGHNEFAGNHKLCRVSSELCYAKPGQQKNLSNRFNF
nr:8334_t:CDS:2 [Entrophospora candida]